MYERPLLCGLFLLRAGDWTCRDSPKRMHPTHWMPFPRRPIARALVLHPREPALRIAPAATSCFPTLESSSLPPSTLGDVRNTPFVENGLPMPFRSLGFVLPRPSFPSPLDLALCDRSGGVSRSRKALAMMGSSSARLLPAAPPPVPSPLAAEPGKTLSKPGRTVSRVRASAGFPFAGGDRARWTCFNTSFAAE